MMPGTRIVCPTTNVQTASPAAESYKTNIYSVPRCYVN